MKEQVEGQTMADQNSDLEAVLDEVDKELTPTATPGASSETDSGNPSTSNEGGETQAQEQSPKSQDSTQPTLYEVAGRKYTLEQLVKAAGHQYKHISRLEQEKRDLSKQFEPFKKLKDAWDTDPAFYDHIQKASDEYHKLKKQGASTAEAKAATGLTGVPKEVLDRLNRQDADLAEYRRDRAERTLDEEVKAVKAKYGAKATDDLIDKAHEVQLDYARETGLDLSVEKALRIVMAEQNEAAAKEAEAKLRRTQVDAAAGAGQSSSARVPDKRGGGNVAGLSDRDYNVALDKELDELGI